MEPVLHDPHAAVQHTAVPGSTLPTRPRPQRSRHAFHMCHLERCPSSSSSSSTSTSPIPNKPPRLSLSKGKYYSPSPKTRQVKCGLKWRSDTTFACELHNCYGLRELKPLIRTTWCICRSVFEHEMETNFQSRSILRHRRVISAIHDIHCITREMMMMMMGNVAWFSFDLLIIHVHLFFQTCLVWRWQVAPDHCHSLCCSTSVDVAKNR